jgi:tripartite-type tricarboxylate transporter receptor subunit TctC
VTRSSIMTNSAGMAPRRRTLLLAAAASLAAPRIAMAQDFPSRPMRIVVPFPAGGPVDIMARIAAEGLTARLGQRVVVENRSGAAGNIAAEFVARGAADGHTLLSAGQAILAINPALYARLPYDPVADFAWIGMIGSSANVILAHPDVAPVANIVELVALARARPGQVTYGSFGPGSLAHLTVEVLSLAAGVRFEHVPYRGAAPMMVDLLAGRIGFGMASPPTAVPAAREGKVRAIGVTTRTRMAVLPDVPTLVESGFPELELPGWHSLVAPAATPAPILARLRAEFDAVLASPAYVAAMDAIQTDVRRLSPAEADTLLGRERRLWAEAVRASGATAE